MNTRARMLGLALGTLLGTASMLSQPLAARDASSHNRAGPCSVKSVAGLYGFNQELSAAATTGEPAVVIGLLNLLPDGKATVELRAFIETGGEPVHSRVYEGEWTVEPNCFGFADFEEAQSTLGVAVEIDYLFVAVAEATELFLVRNHPLEEADAKLIMRHRTDKGRHSGGKHRD